MTMLAPSLVLRRNTSVNPLAAASRSPAPAATATGNEPAAPLEPPPLSAAPTLAPPQMEPSLYQPFIKAEHRLGDTALIQQASFDLDLEGFLSGPGFAPDDWLLPNGAALAPSAYDPLPLPHSLPVHAHASSGHTSPKPSISGGSGGTEYLGTGDSNNADSPHYSSDNNALPDLLPSLARTSRGRSKSSAGKRRKVRPKEKLDTLQKQLDDILQQVQALTLVNQELHRKNDVLSTLLLCSEHVEQISAEALQQHEAFLLNPAGAHEGNVMAAVAKLTPAEFVGTYNAILGEASRWVIQVGELDEGVSEEATARLAAINQRLLDYLTMSSTVRPDLMSQVKQLALKQFNPRTSEEQHWLDILHMLQLQPEQEARMLLAREIFLRCIERLQQERIGLGDALSSGSRRSLDSFDCATCMDSEVLLERVVRNLSKCRNLAMVMSHWLYTRVLTPLQTSKAALHSHPVMPCPLMVMNVLALDVERRSNSSGPNALGWMAVQQQGAAWQSSALYTATVS